MVSNLRDYRVFKIACKRGVLFYHDQAAYLTYPQCSSPPPPPNLREQLLKVLTTYIFTTSCKLEVQFSVSDRALKYYLKVSHDSKGSSFSSCHSKNFEPLSGDNNVAQQRKKRSATSSTAQDEILCYRHRAANVLRKAYA